MSDDTPITADELERAITAAGAFVGFKRDPRIDRPLDEQVAALIEFAIAPTPPKLIRSVPIRWDDYDELITSVVGKLLALAQRASEA